MVKVVACIGSSCHLKGSRLVVETFGRLITENNLQDKVEMEGTFCMGNCQQGVCVTVNGALFSVTPETAENFFETEILTKVDAV